MRNGCPMSLSNDAIVISILIVVNLICGLIGYFIGVFTSKGVYNSPQSFFKQQKERKEPLVSNLSIDDKKFVVDIKTDGMERKYDNLGDVKQTEENISNSVNKLKNLKR